MDGWEDEWMGGQKAILRIAYRNKKEKHFLTTLTFDTSPVSSLKKWSKK